MKYASILIIQQNSSLKQQYFFESVPYQMELPYSDARSYRNQLKYVGNLAWVLHSQCAAQMKKARFKVD